MKSVFGFCFIAAVVLSGCGSNDSTAEHKGLSKKLNESSAFAEHATTDVQSSGSSSKFTSEITLDLKLTPYIPDYTDLGASGKQLLSTRLNQAVSNYAFGGDGGNPRFIIGPSINLLSKNVTSTSPTKYANTYEVTLLSLDVVSETTFASYVFTIKGVGDTPSKAFINGFRDHSFETEDFFDFLQQTQTKIAEYYEGNCDKIILEAEAEANTRNYDGAFALLKSIPMDASACFEKATEKKQEYFQLALNMNCQSLLAKMKAELGKANDPSASGFNDPAMSYYAMIDPASSCYKEAENIYRDHLKKLNPTAKRDWEANMQEFIAEVEKAERADAFERDKMQASFDFEKRKNEVMGQAEAQGNKKLLQKYQYDQLPWLRKIFHLGKHDPFDGHDA